ncbi:hypothetical protein F5887DRAFT_61003 [Amanita rubescens]|nr:hypothetical protein F5887DRAFT_61003 [Amanita rubescens]
MTRKNRRSQAMHDDDSMKDTPPSYYGDYQKHPIFYTEDVFFEIDNTIFKFPKYHLRDSPVFERIFKFAALEDDVEISGAGTAQDPFGCSTIDKRALESFLALQRTAVYDQGPAIVGKGEWLDILKVSYFWKMDKLGKFTVDQLSKMQIGGVEKLKLAKRYDIRDKEWKLTAIRELIKTNIDFSEADVQEIGVDVVLRICELRGMASQRLLFPVSDSNIKKVFPELL